MTIVVDASVAMAWLLPDENNSLADSALVAVEDDGALTPTIFKAECANVLAISVRRKRIGPAIRASALSYLGELDLVFDDNAMANCWDEVVELAEAHDLSVYDALYLETAKRNKLPLATLDKGLKRAAIECGVALFEKVR